jgi:hypothetical protein
VARSGDQPPWNAGGRPRDPGRSKTGGRHHDAPLAGDRLVAGAYQPVEIRQAGQGRLWGHSDILNLDFCWEEGRLRW